MRERERAHHRPAPPPPKKRRHDGRRDRAALRHRARNRARRGRGERVGSEANGATMSSASRPGNNETFPRRRMMSV